MTAIERTGPEDPAFFALLTGSFERLVGRRLLENDKGPEWLYREAPFAVLAHDTASDPVFVYGNVTAQTCFGYDWQEITALQSKLSAGPSERGERQALLDAVTRNGFMENYRGLRVTKSGGNFWMEDGIVWQLRDESGRSFGQAAMFSKWTSA